ncbi:MAG: hypothetical protein ACJA08_002475 [Cyclobacteriaceae bacterium]|jgi:hypothetical protein
MKFLVVKIVLKVIFIIGVFSMLQAQEKPTIALISIDTRNLEIDNITMANMLRLELEKIDRFEVLDKYDVSTTLEKNEIDPSICFGKNALTHAGSLLNADKILTGNAELYGDKIVIILRLIDVKADKVETTSVMEYLNAQAEIQTMGMISLNDLLNIENDPHLVDLLINYSLPITTRQTTVNLNGPRMGAVYTMGRNGDRLRAPKDEGGYNMFPVSMMFGYQYEKQYMSSGDFQALVEVVVAVNGLESGTIIPSVTFLNGFRFNKSGFEFGLGPVLRMVKTEEGYYSNGKWMRTRNISDIPLNVKTEELIDNRGVPKASLGMILAVGKTFKSGYLNMPVNLYLSPIKSGSILGITIGFNTSKKPSFN